MSDYNTEKTLLEWFKQNFPKDSDLAEKIGEHAIKTFSKIPISPHQIINEPFRMTIGNNPSNPARLDFGMNAYGLIFTGIMAKAILDSLSFRIRRSFRRRNRK